MKRFIYVVLMALLFVGNANAGPWWGDLDIEDDLTVGGNAVITGTIAGSNLSDTNTGDNAKSSLYSPNTTKLENWVCVTDPAFGAKGDYDGATGTDNTVAIQAAIDYAETVIASEDGYPQVTASVFIPAGNFYIASGSSLTLKQGVEIYGAGRNATWITHGGGSVPLFTTETSDVSHSWWSLSDISLVGAGATSTYGVWAFRSYFDCGLYRVNIQNFNCGAYFNWCWTFVIDNCDINYNIDNNLEFYSSPDVRIVDTRVRGAGGHNLYVEKPSGGNGVIAFNVKNCPFNISGKSGIYLKDVGQINIEGCSFENNNKDEADNGSCLTQTGARGALNVNGCYFTSTRTTTNPETLHNTSAIYSEDGLVSVSNTLFNSTGTNDGNFEYIFEMDTGVDNLNLENNLVTIDNSTITTEFSIANSATKISVIPTETGAITSSTDALDAGGDLRVVTVSENVTIGGIINGQAGQILNIVKTSTADTLIIEHDENVAGSQDILTNTGSDITVNTYGGVTLYCSGLTWFEISESYQPNSTITTSTDNLPVSGDIRTVFVDATAGSIIIGGITGGFKGQLLSIVKTTATNSLTIEHFEEVGTQEIYTNTSADIVITNYGGVTLSCTGPSWFVVQP